VPELGQDRATRATQLAILTATIATWSDAYTAAHGAGAIDESAWAKTVSFMAGLPDDPISGSPPAVEQLVHAGLLPQRTAAARSAAATACATTIIEVPGPTPPGPGLTPATTPPTAFYTAPP